MKRVVEREKNGFRREYIPLIFAVLFLFILVAALVYAILYKPNKTVYETENTMPTNEIAISTESLTCDGVDIDEAKKKAENVKVSYKQIDDFYFGKANEIDYDNNDDGEVNDGEVDVYGYALRTNFLNVTDGIYLRVLNNVDDEILTIKKSDLDQNGVFVKDYGDTEWFRILTVKVYIDKEGCDGAQLREFEVSLPRWNEISKMPACSNKKMKQQKICEKFTYNDDDLDAELKEFRRVQLEVVKEIEKEKAAEEEAKANKKEIPNYLIYVGIGVLAIVVVVVFVVVCVRIKKGKK